MKYHFRRQKWQFTAWEPLLVLSIFFVAFMCWIGLAWFDLYVSNIEVTEQRLVTVINQQEWHTYTSEVVPFWHPKYGYKL